MASSNTNNSITAKLRQTVVDIGERSSFGEKIYYRAKYGTAQVLCKLKGEEGYAKWFYNLYTGKTLNLDDPKELGEKIWWLKLNNRDPLITICSDKHLVREYVKEKGFEDILIPQFDVYKTTKELDFSKYDCEVIAKCNHNSGGFIFYNPSNPLTPEKLKQEKKRMNFILHQNASVLSREWGYKNIKPLIVVEKSIRGKDGVIPGDHKFFCFNGEPKFMFIDHDTINDDNSLNIHFDRKVFDMDFNEMDLKFAGIPVADCDFEKPENFDYMVEIAKKLSEPFPFCRVDLYNVEGKVYFGEMTFYPSGGCIDLEPAEWNERTGSWIDLNSPKIVKKG